ncbi:MAG: primosomal protein N', partial [Moraxellaceae bacterium]
MPMILQLAIPTPLRRRFDYLPPADASDEEIEKWKPGCLVRVPFGHQEVIGVLLQVHSTPSCDIKLLRPAHGIIDTNPAFTSDILDLCLWAATYYQCPEGEALETALAVLLRQGEIAQERQEPCWQLTTEGKGLPVGALKRAPKQAALLESLQAHSRLSRSDIAALEIPASIIKTLVNKGIICAAVADNRAHTYITDIFRQSPLSLSEEQQAALDQINLNEFQVSLL